MARKKHLKGIDSEDMELIDSKFRSMPLSENYEYADAELKKMKLMDFKLTIKCKNEKQKDFLNNLKDKKKRIVFGVGSAGTGKSYMSLAYALKAIKNNDFEKIIMIVPTAQAVNKDMSFGFLKGELEDKTKPFKDVDRYTIEKILKNSENLGYKQIAGMLINGGYINYEYVNFLLGKSFDNSLILVNEAEQYTKEDLRLILTRLGDDSKMVITGDNKQTNRNVIVKGQKICGLDYASEKLADMEETAITTFTNDEIVRNPLITKILDRID